jgi:hypothetical protein
LFWKQVWLKTRVARGCHPRIGEPQRRVLSAFTRRLSAVGPTRATSAPREASPTAMAFPMPPPAPVTTATRSAKVGGFNLLCSPAARPPEASRTNGAPVRQV